MSVCVCVYIWRDRERVLLHYNLEYVFDCIVYVVFWMDVFTCISEVVVFDVEKE